MPLSTNPDVGKLQKNIERIIKGKSDVVKNVIIGILAKGHVLLEDVPGVGKTTLAQFVAQSINLSFARIQFTSDMLPSDILGVTIYNQSLNDFEFKPGPIFANIVLADEINRTTPKTQSALLEAMNNAQVSVEKRTYRPAAAVHGNRHAEPDRVSRHLSAPQIADGSFSAASSPGLPGIGRGDDHPARAARPGRLAEVDHVLSGERMLEMQNEAAQVKVNEDLLNYIARIVAATRNLSQIELGASTRAALALKASGPGPRILRGTQFLRA